MTALSMVIVWDGNSPCYSWATLQKPTVWNRLGRAWRWVQGD